ncbi:MAG: hypothetical protein HKO81_05150, partial [Flavobacteriaceae bacterium]|nr:hypothetical protein [Flavobacteriaceae bacterium]
KWVSKVFKWLHMIPIYKPDISPDEVHKNKEIFQKCFDHLGNGKTIMIFPEGVSKTERKLRPIKTGAARIALGAEQQNAFDLGVKIVPIGINYSNPHYFRSDVYVHFGSPIELQEYQLEYNEDSIKVAQELTAAIKVRLEQMIVVVEDESIVELVKDIERLYRSTLREELPNEHKASLDFYLSKQIVNAVAYNKKVRPKEYLIFKQKIGQYFLALDRLKLSDTQFRTSEHYANPIWKTSYFIIGFLLFMYGFLVNILPYKTVEFLSRKISVRKDFIGSMKLAFGMFVFLLFYIALILLFTSFTNWIWGLIFALSLYPSGLYTINYINQWYRFRGQLNYLRLASNRKGIIPRLHALREDLLKELDNGREMYLNVSES